MGVEGDGKAVQLHGMGPGRAKWKRGLVCAVEKDAELDRLG